MTNDRFTEQRRDQLIQDLESFYCTRSIYLMDYDLKNLDCLFEEFVINGKEPEDWLFLNDMTNAC
tara:strand:+ start:1711 stop:1905 length:195 start_codon:yes stop_codon:yes gene_type:complete